MHTDADVFPEPYKFKPERWIGDYDPKMNRNYVPFSKGSRSCLGMKCVYCLFKNVGAKNVPSTDDKSSLAYGELYLTPCYHTPPRRSQDDSV